MPMDEFWDAGDADDADDVDVCGVRVGRMKSQARLGLTRLACSMANGVS